MINPSSVKEAYNRISTHVHNTPIISSKTLNKTLGHNFYFKAEPLQKIGAFKIRGALNALLYLKEQNNLPEKVVAFSSGNHAQAVALASKILGVKATIYIPEFSSKVKIQATKSYGAEIILTKTRQEAEKKSQEEAQKGAYFIHPYNNEHIIAGQGTACYEALESGLKPDTIFATCGGGGWIGGSYLAKELFNPAIKIFGAEPKLANDAAKSYKSGEIIALDETPNTIADGARTLKVGNLTFPLIQKLDGFYETEEREIIYWTQWLTNLLKISVEPTSAVAMAAAFQHTQNVKKPQNILVLLSGGNIDAKTYQNIWKEDALWCTPDMLNSNETYLK